MVDVVPEDIERIVGVPRHPTVHYGRAVSSEQTVFILHSHECLDSGVDLRDCPFSSALDRGIQVSRWAGFEDTAVELWVSAGSGRLVPIRGVDFNAVKPATQPTTRGRAENASAGHSGGSNGHGRQHG